MQPRARIGEQIGCGVSVCANRRDTATAEIGSQADLLLPAVRGVARDGASAGRCAEPCGVGDDPRTCELRSCLERSRLGVAPGLYPVSA